MRVASSIRIIAAVGIALGIAWLVFRPLQRKSSTASQTTSNEVTGKEVTGNEVPSTTHPAPGNAESASVSNNAATSPAVSQPDTSIADRVRKLRSLDREINTNEASDFYAYLRLPAPSGGPHRSQENWLRNVMLDKLVEMGTPPAGLAALLIGIYQDPSQDVVMRDYAIQHIAPMYAAAPPDDKNALRETLWNAVGEITNSIGGTALLGLEELASDHPEFGWDKLAEAVFRSAVNGQSSDLVRITAIQICARMGITQATEMIVEVAQNSPSVPLRMSALAAL